AEDGLALSSRNEYLSEEERKQAPVLYRAVSEAARAIAAGEQRAAAVVESMLEKLGEEPLARVQYAEVVDAENLQPVDRFLPMSEVLAAVAVCFGNTRLIDNAFVRVP